MLEAIRNLSKIFLEIFRTDLVLRWQLISGARLRRFFQWMVTEKTNLYDWYIRF
jgi:hypothetical protein